MKSKHVTLRPMQTISVQTGLCITTKDDIVGLTLPLSSLVRLVSSPPVECGGLSYIAPDRMLLHPPPPWNGQCSAPNPSEVSGIVFPSLLLVDVCATRGWRRSDSYTTDGAKGEWRTDDLTVFCSPGSDTPYAETCGRREGDEWKLSWPDVTVGAVGCSTMAMAISAGK